MLFATTKVPNNQTPSSVVIGMFLLLLTLVSAAGSVIKEISIASYSNYLLFFTILFLSIRGKYTNPAFFLIIIVFSTIVSYLSGAQYIYIVLPALVISAIVKKHTHETLTKGSNGYLAFINVVSLFLIAYTVHEYGLNIGVVRTELFRDPNFFASFFLLLGFPILLGQGALRITAMIISGLVIYLTLSRALLIALAFQIVALIAIRCRQYRVTRAACILVIFLSVTSPFITEFIFTSEIHNYSTGVERMIQFNDASNFGRNEQISNSFDYILDNNLLIHGIQDSLLPQKPHNWFWLIAIRFGLLSAFAFLLLISVVVHRVPVRLAAICASAALSAGFLDFHPLVTVLYSIVAFCIVTGQFPRQRFHI